MRIEHPQRFNKEFGLKFQLKQKSSQEKQRVQRRKYCECSNKDKDEKHDMDKGIRYHETELHDTVTQSQERHFGTIYITNSFRCPDCYLEIQTSSLYNKNCSAVYTSTF